jgi:hypothetical protein
MHKYSPEEILFIKENIGGRSYADMTELFNRHFGLRGKKKITLGTMHSFLMYHKMKNGRNVRFGSDLGSPNMNKKGSFKPGHKNYNELPVGTEVKDVDGYVRVKVRNPNTWKRKHIIIWEKAHGKVPKGHIIIFADRNKLNMDLDNLLMVSRGELSVMNRFGLISTSKDLTKAGKLVADIKIRIRDLKRGAEKARTKAKKTGRKKA